MNRDSSQNLTPYLLVLEDDAAIGELLKTSFEGWGYKVKLLQDGKQARNAIRLESFDYIILDIHVPSMSGLQVAAFAKTSELNRSTPLCIASGKIDGDAEKRIAGLKIGHVISKPFSVNGLYQEIDRVIKQRRNQAASYDVRIINSFLAGTKEVFGFYMGVEPVIKEVRVKQSFESAPGIVSSLISYTADNARGSLSICVNAAFVKRLVLKLFDGADVELNQETIADMVGEYCNQVLGAIKREFAKLGFELRLGLPEVVMGKDHVIIHKIKNPILQVPFVQGDAHCVMEFCLEKLALGSSESDKTVEHMPAGEVRLFK